MTGKDYTAEVQVYNKLNSGFSRKIIVIMINRNFDLTISEAYELVDRCIENLSELYGNEA